MTEEIRIGEPLLRSMQLMSACGFGSPEQQLDDAVRYHLRMISDMAERSQSASDQTIEYVRETLARATVIEPEHGGHTCVTSGCERSPRPLPQGEPRAWYCEDCAAEREAS